jgi:hypothetical protein
MDWSHGHRKEDNYGLLWIRGKPGSGKSTLMRAIHENATEIANTNPDMLVVTFFFNARAKDKLEKSSIGMYRSIVHQLLEQMPSQRAKFVAKYRDKLMRDAIDDWTIPDLQSFLRHVVYHLEQHSLVLLLDALDEVEEKDVRALVTFLEDLCRIATENETHLRVCLSSRHYRYIRIRKGSITLALENVREHSRDIVKYIDNWLSKYDEQMPELRTELLRQAKGVFLWVSLAIQQLEDLHDSGDQDAMQERLKRIPPELDDLYSELLTSDTKNMDETIILFQWMLYARVLPDPTSLFSAIKAASNPQSVLGKTNIPNEETVRRFLLSKSKGLVEIVPVEQTQPTVPVSVGHVEQIPRIYEVQFIHETVRSFLFSSEGLSKMQPTLSNNLLGLSHEKLRQICFDCLSEHLIAQMSESSRLESANNRTSYLPKEYHIRTSLPPSYYFAHDLFYHADAAETAGVSQHAFLHEIKSNLHGCLVDVLSREQHLSTSSVLDLVVNQGYAALAKSILTRSDMSDLSAERKDELLALATTQHNYGLCELLVDYCIDLNAYDEKWGSALNRAVYYNQYGIVLLLLNKGVDVNMNREDQDTALLIASEAGALDIVVLLLRYGADVNLRSVTRGSAVDAILQDSYPSWVHHQILRLLLRNGAERPAEPYLAHKLQGKK